MLFPRRSLGRYGRSKIIATLVTFVALWVLIRTMFSEGALWRAYLDLVAPDETPESAFAERVSGIDLEVVGVVEAVLADSLPPGGETKPLQRVRFRSHSGHPLTLIHDPGGAPRALVAEGDTLTARGTYLWDTRGGRLLTKLP